VRSTLSQESAVRLSPPLVFSILVAVSLALWSQSLLLSFRLALSDEQYTHILLILPITLALIFMDWEPSEPAMRSATRLGAFLLICALVIAAAAKLAPLAAHPDDQLSLNMLALVCWWIGAFVISFGALAFQRAAFPLFFLLWIVPFPEFVLNPIVRWLQQGSAASAHLLFSAAGVPAVQEGTLITIPGLTIEVARECSSIRSSLMLIVTSMVLAQMLLRSPWRKALLIAVAIPLSIAKNGLRIFVLGMLGTRVDPRYLTGRLHHDGGIIYFLIALAIIFLLILIARRGEPRREPGA
jgi:exosortase